MFTPCCQEGNKNKIPSARQWHLSRGCLQNLRSQNKLANPKVELSILPLRNRQEVNKPRHILSQKNQQNRSFLFTDRLISLFEIPSPPCCSIVRKVWTWLYRACIASQKQSQLLCAISNMCNFLQVIKLCSRIGLCNDRGGGECKRATFPHACAVVTDVCSEAVASCLDAMEFVLSANVFVATKTSSFVHHNCILHFSFSRTAVWPTGLAAGAEVLRAMAKSQQPLQSSFSQASVLEGTEQNEDGEGLAAASHCFTSCLYCSVFQGLPLAPAARGLNPKTT